MRIKLNELCYVMDLKQCQEYIVFHRKVFNCYHHLHPGAASPLPLKKNLFIYWLHWVFVAVHRLSLAAVGGGYFSLHSVDLSLGRLLLLRSTGSRHMGLSSCSSQAPEHRLSSCDAQA